MKRRVFQPSAESLEPYGWGLDDMLNTVTFGAHGAIKSYAQSTYDSYTQPSDSSTEPGTTHDDSASSAFVPSENSTGTQPVPTKVPQGVPPGGPSGGTAPGSDMTVPVLIVVGSVLVAGGVWWYNSGRQQV